VPEASMPPLIKTSLLATVNKQNLSYFIRMLLVEISLLFSSRYFSFRRLLRLAGITVEVFLPASTWGGNINDIHLVASILCAVIELNRIKSNPGKPDLISLDLITTQRMEATKCACILS
jgi:hypothetical protein